MLCLVCKRGGSTLTIRFGGTWQEHARLLPQLYAEGPLKKRFNWRILSYWLISALWQSLACFYVPILTFAYTGADKAGSIFGLWEIGTISYTLIITVVSQQGGFTWPLALCPFSNNKLTQALQQLQQSHCNNAPLPPGQS